MSEDTQLPLNLEDTISAQTEINTPVVCLGITFTNVDERRAYYREELRKKLPELKRIEGFPIGEDDDIINLSDPPYYTACPNPWLNDFISEWEKEKEELERQSKRTRDFEVTEPYASDVSEGKNNPIYMAHAYHTKVPHPAIMRYILHYTQPGDIVFDGFAGTGMTGVAANLCGSEKDVNALNEKDAKVGVRHGICSDLSPIASLIAASYNLKFDTLTFERQATAILKQVEYELGWMYETKINGHNAKINYVIWSDVFTCPSCGQEIVLWKEAVSADTKTINDTFACPHCKVECSKKALNKAWETSFDSLLSQTVQMNKKVPVRINYTLGNKRSEKNAEQSDFDLIAKIEEINTKGLNSREIFKGDESARIENYGISHTHQFYTKRNYIFLSRVYELVNTDIFLMTWFTSTLQNVSKMWKFKPDRKGGTLNGTLYIPSLNLEQQPYKVLVGKIRAFISSFYSTRGNGLVNVASATNLQTIPCNCIDYMFIDPPFGANIMYSELNSIWEGWLRVKTENKEEAIVNNSQRKSLFDYQVLMNRSLREFYRVLKPGKWLTMEFSNTSAAVWNSIQNALQGVGFVLANVSALDKQQGSFKAVTTTTAVKQDLIITCFKPSEKLSGLFNNTTNVSANVWDFVEELLLHLPVHVERNKSTTAVVERSQKILYDRLISFYVQHGYTIPLSAQEFQRGLNEHFIPRDGMFFTAEQALQYEEKRSQTTGVVQMSVFVSSEEEGIEWLKRKLDTPQTYQDLQPQWMQDLAAPRKGDNIPELKVILEDNFLHDEDGRWYKPDLEKESDLEKVRTRKLLREFNYYVELAAKPKVKIKEARLEALRCGFRECYRNNDFQTIVSVGNRLPEALVMEDVILLQFYDIALAKV